METVIIPSCSYHPYPICMYLFHYLICVSYLCIVKCSFFKFNQLEKISLLQLFGGDVAYEKAVGFGDMAVGYYKLMQEYGP